MPQKPPRKQAVLAAWNALYRKALGGGTRWLGTLAVAMTLAYLLVTQFLEGTHPPPPHLEALREAGVLRGYTNELLVLLDEFVAQTPGEGRLETAAFERWAERNFRPRVNDLRQRLVQVDMSNAALTALLAASDRAGALAGRPLDDWARSAALDAALRAAQETETHIARLNAEDGIAPRAFRPSFAKE